ncbi:MAG: hypothetical protein LLG04_14050 [Parachlamydia sp.]|nr:hypothetical protein [Parachlamydia sp.]
MSGTEGLGEKLSAFAKTGGQDMNIAIYQKGKSFSFSVTREPKGPFAKVGKLFQNIKEFFAHQGKTKLDAAATVLVLTRAAELAEGAQEKTGSSKAYFQERIDPVARELLKNLKEIKAPVLREAGKKLEIKEHDKIQQEGSQSANALHAEKEAKLRDEVGKAIAGLTSLQDREIPTLNVQEAGLPKANALLIRHGEVLPSGVQDLWRGATSYKIMQQTPDGKVITRFDGAKKKQEMSQASKAEQSEACTKEIIKIFGERMLPGVEERERLEASLGVADLNTDGNAVTWGKDWQRLGAQIGSFDALLTAMSQKLYLQATGTLRLEYGMASQGRDFNLIDGEKSLRKYEVTFLANGNIQVKVHLPYEMRAKPQEGEAKGQQLASFHYVSTWEFDPLMSSCEGFKADVENLQMHDAGQATR